MNTALVANNLNLTLASDRATLSSSLDFTTVGAEELATQLCNFLEVGKKTALAYRKAIGYFLDWLKARRIQHPTSETIRDYKRGMIEEGKAPSTINLYLASIRQLFSFLSACGAYPNVCFGVKKVKDSEPIKKLPLSKEQTQDYLERDCSTIGDLRDRAIVTLMVYTGLRCVSVREANVEDLEGYGRECLLYVRNKGSISKDRFVVVPASAVEVLREYLKARKAKPGEPLFTSLDHSHAGQRISERGFGKIVKEDLKQHGYDSHRLTPHSLRHTHCTLELEAGVPVLEVSREVMHASVVTTERYLHLTGVSTAPSKRLETFLGR